MHSDPCPAKMSQNRKKKKKEDGIKEDKLRVQTKQSLLCNGDEFQETVAEFMEMLCSILISFLGLFIKDS